MIDFGSVFESYSPSEKRKEMQEGCLVTWDQPASPGLYMSGTQVAGGAEAALTSIKDIWSASTCRVGDGEKGPTCG